MSSVADYDTLGEAFVNRELKKEKRAGVDHYAFSRPKKLRCGGCIRRSELKPKTSKKLAEERRERVEGQLREAAEGD